MKKLVVFLPIIIISLASMSQNVIEGEYYFRKMEMASGFNFTKDGKFRFFYAYGSVDRTATGSFTIDGDTLKLRSDKEPGKDFTIINQSKQRSGYNIAFKHPNKYLVKNIICIFVIDGQAHEAHSDENGEVNVDLPHCDTIYAVHNLYPDVPTLIKDEKNENNQFALELKPSLEQVSFKDIIFKIIDGKTISCSNNYFMDAIDIKFTKQ
ncbi:MAG TPA: hypothetical protein VGI82_03315 [Chitinophagaceae bacterium]